MSTECRAATAGVTNPYAEYAPEWYCTTHQCWNEDDQCHGVPDSDYDYPPEVW